MKREHFVFKYFKEYASFCLYSNFDKLYIDFISRIKEVSQRPHRLFPGYTEDQINNIFRERLVFFLKSVIEDSAFSEVESIVKDWKEGKLPHINKYAVQPSDIILSFAARKNSLLALIPHFTKDFDHGLSIGKELSVFNLLLEEKIFQAYIEIQQEVIYEKNEELNKANHALQFEVIDRIETEEKLRREKDFSEAVINNSIDGIFAFNKELKITAWNKTLEKLNGLSKEAVFGKNIFELFPNYEQTEEGQAIRNVLQGIKSNFHDKRYKNHRGYYEAHFVPLLNDKNEVTGGLSIIHDITHRKIAEEKIQQRENLLKEAQEIAHMGSWEWIVRNNKMNWSDEMYHILGYENCQVEISNNSFLDHVVVEERESVKAKINEAFHNLSPFSFETRIITKTGLLRCLLVKGKVLAYYNNVPYKMMGIVWDITERRIAEDELLRKNSELEEKNEKLKKIEAELTLANNELELRVTERTKQLSLINAELNNEIGERKKMEEALKQRNEELLKINDDLDNFVYTASHDLKAPISNIEGLISTLNFELQNITGEGKVIIDLINHSLVRFKETLNDLAEIAKAQKNLEEDIALIDLHHLLDEIKLSVKDMIINCKANIIYDGCNFPQVKFSKANLKSILYNLLTNAIKYRHPDRDPVVHIHCERRDEYVLLSVSDNGLGIKSDQVGKIFTMFKRLHDHVEGSGIGLYLVKRIVDNSKGKIEVESEEGKGSTFRIYLKI
ncbi:MAG: PAS domain-containing sensor histidine kinase [Cytophagaceae bacterium]|nr:PAS domain-containing sensor histidine kinase [Cytophagaceae bacterium]